MKPDIAIVAVGYNRPQSLKRLLVSLGKAEYNQEATLYISLDGGGGKAVHTVAKECPWKAGPKRILLSEVHLGLRDHVLRCGDLSARHDAIIVLEDDLAVSPQFYVYALEAYDFYKDDEKIAGISLYHHAYNETAQFPFVPLSDGSDVYFLQYASSWGQMWTTRQWTRFRDFFKTDAGNIHAKEMLAPNIRLWPDSSWKKHFIEYMVTKDLYFVFPRTSLSTVFAEQGTHNRTRETFLQVSLSYSARPWIFSRLEDSFCVYDVYCEMLPDRLKRLWKETDCEDFDVDLYGMKTAGSIRAPNLISSRPSAAPWTRYGRERKPHEDNLIHNTPGNDFRYDSKYRFKEPPYMARLLKCHEKKELAYWYPIREYHFYNNTLLSTEKNPLYLRDPGFIFKKFATTFRFAIRYYLHRG